MGTLGATRRPSRGLSPAEKALQSRERSRSQQGTPKLDMNQFEDKSVKSRSGMPSREWHKSATGARKGSPEDKLQKRNCTSNTAVAVAVAVATHAILTTILPTILALVLFLCH